MKEINIRTYGAATAPTLDGRTVEGYAIVFNSPSCLMYDKRSGEYFVEYISPEAVDEGLIQRSDVKALYNHAKDKLLARSRNGEGSLRLTLDEKGLKYCFEAPDTVTGQEVVELLRRGDLCASSFAFIDEEDKRESVYNTEKRYYERTIKHISGLYDVSVVSDPAYAATSASVRMASERELQKMQQSDLAVRAKEQTERYSGIKKQLEDILRKL